MTATEEVCRLLDERGVKYWDMKTRGIWFGINADGSDHSYEAYDQTNSLIEIATFDLTPEQAIAATLGATDATSGRQGDVGECHTDETETIECIRIRGKRLTTHAIIVSDESTDCATGHCECELCSEPIDPWDKYCRHCGAEVEQ